MKEQQKEWEEKFDKEFVNLGTDERDFEGTLEKTAVKSFITANFIERSELLRAIEGMKREASCDGKLKFCCADDALEAIKQELLTQEK